MSFCRTVELLGSEAARKGVRIETRRAGKRNDIARVRIDGDGRAALARQAPSSAARCTRMSRLRIRSAPAMG